MCGIAGSIELAGKRQPDESVLRAMAAALVHRGPDDSGFLRAPGIGLAQRRLSIVGLQDGQQPIFNEDRSVALVCNGELFDFPERRAELESKGHKFRTHSDCEIIVHLYEEYGEDLFMQLKGQYAFALVDFNRNTVFLARDRVGICPLFWSRQGDTVYFASEIKAMLAAGVVPPEADPRGLDHLFTFFALGTRRTAFKNVQAIAPGHYLKIDFRGTGGAAAPVERKYWDLDFPDWGQERDGDESQLVDEFEAAFTRAVELRLRADVPVVSYLSGGVDSAYVMATAARIKGEALPSFTLRIPGKSLDEVNNALHSSRAIGDRMPTIVEADADCIKNSYVSLTTAAECPVLDTSCAALLALSGEVRAQGYKAVLTGEGADEAFAGYIWFKVRELMRSLDIGDAFRPSAALSRAVRKFKTPGLTLDELRRIDGLVGGPHAQSVVYGLVATARERYFSDGFREQLDGHVAYEDLDLNLDRMAKWHPLNRSLYLGYKVHLSGLLLTQKGDRIAMANSVEARYPFLDEDVISLVSEVHPRWKLRRGLQDKFLLRKAAERVLPKSVAQRRKHMFRAPFADSFLADAPPFVRELVSPESLARTGYFDVAQVRRDCDVLARDGHSRKLGSFESLGLGGVVATQLWHHLYLGGGLCSLPTYFDTFASGVAPSAKAVA